MTYISISEHLNVQGCW